jgi:hypothetical protein
LSRFKACSVVADNPLIPVSIAAKPISAFDLQWNANVANWLAVANEVVKGWDVLRAAGMLTNVIGVGHLLDFEILWCCLDNLFDNIVLFLLWDGELLVLFLGGK